MNPPIEYGVSAYVSLSIISNASPVSYTHLDVYKRQQSGIGAVIVLAVEFISGCVLNLWLGLGVWDYSNQPGNVLGQICPAFGLLWFFIMPLAIWAEDTTRYLIWAYDCAVYHSQEAPPTIAPYSLKSVYGDFILSLIHI